MSKPSPPAPTASAIGPFPTVIKIEGRPGTGSLPSIITPPDHPLYVKDLEKLMLGRTAFRPNCIFNNDAYFSDFGAQKFPLSFLM